MEILFKLPPDVLDKVNWVASWIGFSAVVGLVTGAVFFRRQAPPALLTIVLGYVGTIIGWSLAKVYTSATGGISGSWQERLLSPATFLIGVAGTAGLLFLFKVLGQQQAAQGDQKPGGPGGPGGPPA